MKTALLLALALAAVGCDRKEPTDTDTAKMLNAPADNTKKNQRDRTGLEVTPGDQGSSPVDVGITQAIRQGVVKDDSLSLTAKNIKIITYNGVVTLRGPVKTDKERMDIGALAQRVDNVKQVDNKLEVAAN